MEIEIINIHKSYGKNHILKGISLRSGNGKCIGILGKNGCGKSTLFTILAGVQKGDKGDFLINGHSLFKNTSYLHQNVGFVPQVTPLIEELTAYDNLLLWYSGKQIKKELSGGVLKMLGINEFLKTPVSKTSEGMKKRLAIGCAMYTRPPVLLLDEPCAALDIECKVRILDYLRDYKSRGGSILISSHDPMEMEICDECHIMKSGILHEYDYDGNIVDLVNAL